MSVSAFLSELRDLDIRVQADGDRLRCNAPAGALTAELREELEQRKREILEFLRAAETLGQHQRAIVPLQPGGTRTPVFGAGGHNGDVFCYRALAEHLGTDQPFYGLQPPGLDGHGEPLTSIEGLAAYFAGQIRAFLPRGPLVIAGYCTGGTIAFELARQLRAAGADVECLVFFGAPWPGRYGRMTLLPEQFRQYMRKLVQRFRESIRKVVRLSFTEQRRLFADKLCELKTRRSAAAEDSVVILRGRVERATIAAARRYRPPRYSGRVRHLLPSPEWVHTRNQPLRWATAAPRMEKYFGPPGCRRNNMLLEPHVAVIAKLFRNAVADNNVASDAEADPDRSPGPRAGAVRGDVLPASSNLSPFTLRR